MYVIVRSADAIIVSKMAARRPLSPSVLGATTAAKTDLAVDHSCGDAVVGASPAIPVRPASGRGGSSSDGGECESNDNGPELQAKLRHRTKAVVCLLLLVVSITVPFIAWHLTIGRGPSPPTFQFDQCNYTDARTANSNGESDISCCNGCRICDLPVNEVLFATALCGGVLAYIAKRRGMESIPYAPAIAAGYGVTMAVAWSSPRSDGLWEWITGGAA